MHFFIFFLLLAAPLLGDEARLFDTFLFCNELDMLELRLAEHDSAVDYFVLVEAAKTFTGEPKPLCFEQNKERFAKWKDKLIYLILDDFPEEMRSTNCSAWDREYYQRNFALTALAQLCSPNDLILHSDCDEIVSAEILHFFKQQDNPSPHCLVADFYYYNCNWKKSFPWEFIYIAKYEDLVQTGLLTMRFEAYTFPKIRKAAWHLSYFMTPEEIAYKIKAFSHTEMNKPDFTDLLNIEKAISSGKDLFHREALENCVKASKNDLLPKNIGILPARYQRKQ
jgi:hypothetical protein